MDGASRGAKLIDRARRRRGATSRSVCAEPDGAGAAEAPDSPEAAAGAEAAAGTEADPTLDVAVYSCGCGYVFEALVSTSVGCPHCGDHQAW